MATTENEPGRLAPRDAPSDTSSDTSSDSPSKPDDQREALLASERAANAQQPRNFKEDALTDKIVSVEPDGTGPTPTKTFDTETDRKKESGPSGG